MGMGFKGKSASQVARRLENASDEAKSKARQQVKDEGENIRTGSRDRAPVDEGNLEAAHKIETKERPDGITVRVFVDPVHGTDSSGNTAPGPYLDFIHFGSYSLGPKSVAKQAGSSQVIGPNFLLRAYNERQKVLEKKLANVQIKAF